MRIGRRAARYYVTEEVVETLARELSGTKVSADQANSGVVSILEERRKRRTRSM
jgi:hypothetical protein